MAPPPRQGAGRSDNSDSIVLDIGFAGRRLLLPGDLESTGLDSLLRRTAIDYDLVMAPHHGSPHSRPIEFLKWANPQYVVVSSRRGANEITPNVKGSEARFFHTGRDGAVRMEIDEVGRLTVNAWRQHRW